MLIGTRVHPNEKGFLDSAALRQPGAFGRPTFDFVKAYGPNVMAQTYWVVTCPDGSQCSLNPKIHTITEHENGDITVHPSIVTPTWHGWLVGGVWKAVGEP